MASYRIRVGDYRIIYEVYGSVLLLATTMDRICVDHDPVIITRNRDQAVVMLSLDDYESLQETAYLLRSPASAKRLLASIESLNTGKTVRKNVKDLVEA